MTLTAFSIAAAKPIDGFDNIAPNLKVASLKIASKWKAAPPKPSEAEPAAWPWSHSSVDFGEEWQRLFSAAGAGLTRDEKTRLLKDLPRVKDLLFPADPPLQIYSAHPGRDRA